MKNIQIRHGFKIPNGDKLPDGTKYDEEKERFDLIPPEPLIELAKVYTHGATKYEPRNMEKGMAWGRVFGAIMRHLWKFWCGEDRDPESGLHHVAQAAWGCFTLLDYTKNHPKFDDRVKPVLDKDQVEFEKTCKDIQDKQ